MQAKKAHSIDKQNRFPLNHSMDLDGLNISEQFIKELKKDYDQN